MQQSTSGIQVDEDELTRLGYSVQMCLTDFGETAEAFFKANSSKSSSIA
jgi:hypothetical protein